MKKMIYRALSLLLVILLHACEYKDIYDAGSEYPVDKVYIAGTYESIIYKVDQIVETENAPFRYKIDVENNKVLIPLGVCRSSVWSNNDVSVELGIDNDTIPALIDSEELVGEDGTIPEILPADKYRLDTEIHIAKGEDLGQLNLTVDIPFLLDNLDKRYVLGIRILNSNAEINEKMSLIVVDITAGFIEPQPDFTFEMDEKKPFEVSFSNKSVFCLDYEWDFDDGSSTVNEKEPQKHVFPGVGIYNVKLTSKGTRGNLVTKEKVVHIWEDITDIYIKNGGNPFQKAGLVYGHGDCLKDWTCTENVLSTYNSSKKIYVGGYQGDNGGVMDFYANKATTGALENAKIYQTTDLPEGAYYAAFVPFSFVGKNNCYFVVAKGVELPDIDDVESNPNVIAYLHWDETIEITKQGMEFEVLASGPVTIGFVVSNDEGGRVKIKSVSLAK